MSRHTPGTFLLLKGDTIVGKIEDAEQTARELGILKVYEVVQ
jgi:hypothetical protein